jgi:DNA-binding MarR family transcriptional regulator
MSNNVTTTEKGPARSRAAPRSPATPPVGEIGLGMLPELIGYHVRLAQMAVFADFERSLGTLDLSPGLFGLLVIIEANPGLRQIQLAAAARLDRSTLVPALDKLEARGLVERRAAPDDRRSNGLFLTQPGAGLLQRAKAIVRDHEQRIAGALSAEERAVLVRFLDRLAPEVRGS